MDGLNDLAIRINQTARDKGWWEGQQVLTAGGMLTVPRSVGEVLMLIVSEVSEAMEEYRDGHGLQTFRYVHKSGESCDPTAQCRAVGGVDNDAKPEGFPIEMADVLIRLLDACAQWNVDIEEAVRAKMSYNVTRPVRHGGKLA